MTDLWTMDLTFEQAEQVRQWRVDEAEDLNNVGELASELWGDGALYGGQLLGAELCRKAAVLFGEDAYAEDWGLRY
jgi:hypothetical protein